MFTFFTAFFMIIHERIIDYQEVRLYENLRELGMLIDAEIELAAHVEDGYTREFKLPPTIRGVKYETIIDQSPSRSVTNVIVQYKGLEDGGISYSEKYVFALPTNTSVSGINSGFNTIIKEKSLIYINTNPP